MSTNNQKVSLDNIGKKPIAAWFWKYKLHFAFGFYTLSTAIVQTRFFMGRFTISQRNYYYCLHTLYIFSMLSFFPTSSFRKIKLQILNRFLITDRANSSILYTPVYIKFLAIPYYGCRLGIS